MKNIKMIDADLQVFFEDNVATESELNQAISICNAIMLTLDTSILFVVIKDDSTQLDEEPKTYGFTATVKSGYTQTRDINVNGFKSMEDRGRVADLFVETYEGEIVFKWIEE